MVNNKIIQGLLVFLYMSNFATAQEYGEVESATTCKECHEEIYNEWISSQHARSTPEKNPLFAGIYNLSREDTRDQTRLYCIRCHAPVSQINGDVDLALDITNEGVTCDVCHTMTDLSDHPDKWPNKYKPGKTKRGPNMDVESDDHQVTYSLLFENSLMCTGCHGTMLDIPGTRSCGNLTICDTNFEWQGTKQAARGKSCTDCHMTRPENGKENNGDNSKPRHDFSGAYSLEMLQKAAELTLDLKVFEGEIIADLGVVNAGAAHLAPTGPPARMVILKVVALDRSGEVVWSNFSENPVREDPFGVFHIVFADSEGKIPSMPWLAARIVKDTRLRPGETRRLVYKFPASGVEKVTARLIYRLAPPAMLEGFGITDEAFRKGYLMAQVETSLPR